MSRRLYLQRKDKIIKDPHFSHLIFSLPLKSLMSMKSYCLFAGENEDEEIWTWRESCVNTEREKLR